MMVEVDAAVINAQVSHMHAEALVIPTPDEIPGTIDLMEPETVGVGLSVIIVTRGEATLNVTEQAQEVVFSNEMPGGYASCSFKLPLSFHHTHPEIEPWGDVVINEGEAVVYQGRIEKVTRIADDSGSWVELEAYGWQRHAQDVPYRGIIRDRRLSEWEFDTGGDGTVHDWIESSSFRLKEDDDGDPYMRLALPKFDAADSDEETAVSTNDRARIKYTVENFPNAGIRRLHFKWKASVGTAELSVRVYDGPSASASSKKLYERNWTANNNEYIDVTLTNWKAGSKTAYLYLAYVNDGFTSLKKRSIKVRDVYIEAAPISTPTASKIVKTVISANCPKFDTTGVQTTTRKIEQLVYEDPTNPSEVFTQMLAFAPADVSDDAEWKWGVWEKMVNDKYRFTFEPIPSGMSYEVSAATIDDISYDYANTYNEAIVQFVSPIGNLQETKRTRAVDSLDDAGLTRTAFVEGLAGATTAQAQELGDVFLKEHSRPARQGAITVYGDQVRNAGTHTGIPFWRLRAGLRIRIVDLRSSDLPIPEREGFHAFIIRRVEVNLGGGYAVLTLDNLSDRADNFIARFSARRKAQ